MEVAHHPIFLNLLILVVYSLLLSDKFKMVYETRDHENAGKYKLLPVRTNI